MIPDEVNVGGMTYSVSEVETVDRDLTMLGACNYIFNDMQIKSDMSEERKEQTFVHELLHAVHHEAGYEEQDEEMIDRVSKVLYQVLKDNKIGF